ncbi:MAG: DUF58 domain-containing protein [Bifidobacterium sp.]|nr:DUF58 domain-containing protein [Bifidobacterium sp.]
MIAPVQGDDPVRRKIESLGTSLSLPTVRRALGVVEGEHRSAHRGGTDDLVDIRAYDTGDEARHIDWKISARTGRPMVVQRERQSSSRVYLLLDGGERMLSTCRSGEPAVQVAANALCMFAALSLRRSDDVSLVIGDATRITRVPFHGAFAQFERTLDGALDRDWSRRGNLGALLDYAQRIRDRDALVVLATCEQTLTQDRVPAVRRIARTHPFVLIDVQSVNPFAADPIEGLGRVPVVDGGTGRRLPAFLVNHKAAKEVETHRAFVTAALKRELARCGARLVHADGSQAAFHSFVRLLSASRSGSGFAAPAGSLGRAGGRA